MEDSAIVDLYLSRDETAISHTAEKYGSRLRQIASGILNSRESAQECENDTYLETWNRIPPHEPRTYLFAFLGKILRHIAIDECRRNASTVEGDALRIGDLLFMNVYIPEREAEDNLEAIPEIRELLIISPETIRIVETIPYE